MIYFCEESFITQLLTYFLFYLTSMMSHFLFIFLDIEWFFSVIQSKCNHGQYKSQRRYNSFIAYHADWSRICFIYCYSWITQVEKNVYFRSKKTTHVISQGWEQGRRNFSSSCKFCENNFFPLFFPWKLSKADSICFEEYAHSITAFSRQEALSSFWDNCQYSIRKDLFRKFRSY